MVSPGEERSDETWGRMGADNLNTGLEEGEHGLSLTTITLDHVRPLRGRIAKKPHWT
jgi:hypothetical protein